MKLDLLIWPNFLGFNDPLFYFGIFYAGLSIDHRLNIYIILHISISHFLNANLLI